MGVGRFLKSDRKMMFFGVFSKISYYGRAACYHVLSSFPSRTRWHRPFSPIRVSTPSKTRLKVESVHAAYMYCVLRGATQVCGWVVSKGTSRAVGWVFDPRGFLLALQYKFCAMRFNQTTLHMQKLQQTFEISAKIYKMSDSDENSHDSHGTFCSRRAGDSRPVRHNHKR